MRGEEGKAGRGEIEEKERVCRDTQPYLQLLAWLSAVPSNLSFTEEANSYAFPAAALTSSEKAEEEESQIKNAVKPIG